jgi:hypothetical protein
VTATATLHQCDERPHVVAGAFGFRRERCQRLVGVLVWTDATGRQHAACASHVRDMERRWPMAEPKWDLPEPVRVWERLDAHSIGCPARYGDGDCDEDHQDAYLDGGR